MPKYELVGRLVFKARDVRDAFKKLAQHFGALSAGEPSNLPEIDTDIQVRGIGSEETEIPPPPRLPRIIIGGLSDEEDEK